MLNLPQTVKIKDIQQETRTIRTFVLDAELPEATPGQFIMLWLPDVDEKPMSIASPAPLTVTVARVGPFSTVLHQRKVGDKVGWRGPYGRGFSLHKDRPAILIAGGCGVGPMYFLARRAVEKGVPTTVAIGARTEDALPYVEKFRALDVDGRRLSALILATDDGTHSHRGLITDVVWQKIALEQLQTAAIYACGPEPMLVALHRLCREHDVPGQLSVERYMKCGFGICGQCALDGLLVCQDGPVFEVEELDGLRDFGHAQRTATGRRLPLR
ncbi:MAG TPA: dihydroorotate dehydrogenase electron transfer subunit [Chloroflexi bacterium]|nr:dihydroorotate dehydrogenase electron transfer subunit [Chloroflexota bacterium]